MNYGYIQAITGTPDYHAQHFGILSVASNNRLGQVNFIQESAPVQPDGASPVLSGMISSLLRDDTLLLTKIGDLGRSTVEVLDALRNLSMRGVRLYAVNSAFQLDNNPDALVVATACSLVAQIEKELRVHPEPDPAPVQMTHYDADPQTPARRARKSKLDGHLEQIQSMLADGHSLSEIARILNVATRQSLSNFVRSRNLSDSGQVLS
jgi:hypothetical protein